MQNGTSDGLLFYLAGFSSVEIVCVCVCVTNGSIFMCSVVFVLFLGLYTFERTI